MSEQFEPTTDDFRQVWAAFNGYGGLVARPHSVSMDEGYAEFDRWLERVRAEAWTKGWAECWEWTQMAPKNQPEPSNPYEVDQ